MNGVEATLRIVASGTAPRVLLLTTFDLDEYAHAGLRAGPAEARSTGGAGRSYPRRCLR